MLNLLNKSDKHLKGLVLSKAPDLWTKRKDNRLLVVNGNLGTWTILDEQFQGFFKKLEKPVLYPDFIANNEGIPPAMFIAFMEKLYGRGMLLLSGRKLEFSGAGKVGGAIAPGLFYFHFTKDSPESYDYFFKFAEQRIQVEKSERFNFHMLGKFTLSSSDFHRLISRILEKAGICGKRVSFSAEANSPDETIPERISKFPLTLEFMLKVVPGFFEDDEKKSEMKKLLSGMAKIREMGLNTGIKAVLYEPLTILPLMKELIAGNVSNIALKIAPDIYIPDAPIVKSIKTMEAFGFEYIKMLDSILPDLLYGYKRLVLRDVHRFLFRLTGYDTPYPCGFSPCGMGEQVVFTDDDEILYACRYMEKSREKLSLGITDINCPAESEKLRFWKTTGVEDSTQCRRCPWKYFCGGGCPVLTFEKYGTLNREDPRCRFFRIIFENLIWKFYDTPLIVRALGGLI